MDIQTVKDAGESVLVNGNLSVPKNESNRHYQAVLQWVVDGGVIEPEFSDAEILADAIYGKVADLNAEAVTRVQPHMPVANMDGITLAKTFYNGVSQNSRNPNSDLAATIAISDARDAAEAAVRALTVLADVQAYDVVNTPSWP